MFLSFFLVCLLIIIFSYSSMAIRILCGIQPHRHGATSRERQLTKTLFITTLMSLLLTLPFLVFWIFDYSEISRSTSYRTVMRSSYVLSFFYFTNSIANPVIYAFRIPEFKGALYSILCFRSQPQPVQV